MCARPWLFVLLCFTPAGPFMADDRTATLAHLRDVDARVATAAEIAYLGHRVDWQQHSLDELQEIEKRIRTAKSLMSLGHEVDWQDYALEELMDRNERVWMANQLATKYSHFVDWTKHSFDEMESIEHRIKLAHFLASYYGEVVDWKDYDMDELQDLRSRIIVANNLARRGQQVDWRKVTSPPKLYEGLSPEDVRRVQFVSQRSGSTSERTMILIESSLQMLQAEEITVERSQLIRGSAEIYRRIYARHATPFPQVLAAYVTQRRNDVAHDVSVQNVIREFPRAPIVFVSRGDNAVRWVIQYREENIAGRLDAKYYVAWGSVENLGKDELLVPNGRDDGGAEMLLLVDQSGQRYSPIPTNRTMGPEAILRPGLASGFTYYFEVPFDSTVTEFVARDLDQVKDQFGDDEQIRIPVREPAR